MIFVAEGVSQVTGLLWIMTATTAAFPCSLIRTLAVLEPKPVGTIGEKQSASSELAQEGLYVGDGFVAEACDARQSRFHVRIPHNDRFRDMVLLFLVRRNYRTPYRRFAPETPRVYK